MFENTKIKYKIVFRDTKLGILIGKVGGFYGFNWAVWIIFVPLQENK